jgi:hypothetical protein
MTHYQCRCGSFSVIGSIMPASCNPCIKCNTIPSENRFTSKKCTTEHDFQYKLNEIDGNVYKVCINCNKAIKIN